MERNKSINFYELRIQDIVSEPNYPWDFSQLHKSRHFNIIWINKYPDKPWNFSKIYFTPDFIKKFDISWVDQYPEQDWPFSFFHQCNRFKHEWIEKYPDRDWNYQDISRFHVGLDKLVIKYPDKPWDYSNVGLYCSNLDNLLDKLPDKPWDFSILHRDTSFYEFNINLIHKFPDKNWNYQAISSLNVFDISFFEKYPDKPWDFSTMYLGSNFDISWVEKYPDKPWDFKYLHLNLKFDITWVDKLPDKPWNFKRLHYRFSVNESDSEDGNIEEICPSDYDDWAEEFNPKFNLSWIEKYPDKSWNFRSIFEYQPNIINGLTWKQQSELNYYPNIVIAKYCIFKKYCPNCKIYNMYPELFHNIDKPVQLQDLSGEIFYLENWFTQDNILEYAKSQFPDLGEFDIAIDSLDESEELLLASETEIGKFKSHLFQNKEGPHGMIVYQ